ncbi:hypothetical protein FHL15_007412 [Xylaria flabelliformis]|uniref:Uncharacterized protein n=1 Tax=Xylaria flabelliformis TaxID=2512241 RepID=A0A553HUJ6_9PEZI|nr:hypothetical protein FHL15_007412 [Xylaria flabelliformis]
MSNPQSLKQPCRLFKNGNCRFGARCKFSHDLARGSQVGNRHTAPSTAKSSQRPNPTGRDEDDLREWKRLLRQGRQSPSRTICDRFFELAVKLVDGDPGGLQEAIKLLADEDGLAYIRLLVERHIPNAAKDYEKRDIWTKQIQPLFTVVTDQRVADSALLEQPVAAIYNFMQGVGSRRMKLIFEFSINLTQLNLNTKQPATSILVVSNQVIIEKCLAVLSKMIDCSTNNIVDETFKTVAQRIELISKQVEKTSDDYLILQSQKWISYINRRIRIGDELPFSEVRTAPSIESRAEFTLPKNLPGNLSASGRRHTNDHADITNISILPTQDEIVSTRGEYLPSNDPTSFHHPGIIGRLDREFRLLREDTIGQLRDVVREVFEEIQGRKKIQRHERQSLRTYTYKNAEFVHISFEHLNGLDLLIRFPQPMRNSTGQKRRDWWSVSKRLQPGALVCVISEDGSVLFCVVAEATVITADEKAKRNRRTDTAKETPEQTNLSLAEDDAFAYIHLNIAEFKDNNFRQALRWYQNVGPKLQLCLVEFPGILLASFQHTLTALQRMSKTSDVPFVDLIAPLTPRAGIVDIPPPQYTTKPGFYFDLSCLTKDGVQLRFSPTQHLDPQILTKQSTLDETQSIALVDSLSRGLALIQGPPGTGKSYTGEKIIRVLLANKARGQLGPILCVCYTNHALDQLLEHLLDDGIKQIIRIGSRSKSERLEEVNLRIIARAADRTKSEGSSLWDTKKALIVHESTASKSLQELEHCLGRPTIQAYLAEHYPQHHQTLFGTLIDEDGFQEVRHRPHQLFDQWLNGGTSSKNLTSRPVEQLLTADLWNMNRGERHRLYYHWQRKIRDPIIQDLLLDYRDYTKTREQRNRINQEIDLRCLSTANVVGVTTTGLARNIDLLRRLRCKVLICEEAGEVLEAHNLTALLPSIEHCVLIGDQLQLRPQIQNYDLNSTNPRGAQYSLDVSLFERLISPSSDREQKLPFNTLETQRRMHPCISELTRRTLYPTLVDGGAVTEYPEVQGLRKRLFWLEHTVLEDRAQQQDPTSTSHTNSFEVDMTVAFVQHLVRQGTYGPDDIAVITPYLGQLYRLRRAMQSLFQISVGERDLEELEVLEADNAQQESATRVSNAVVRTTLLKSIRLATVDNFQGEEAKVVVISLVRSNSEQRCGFLSTPNRINVLLSRAKHGMYLIGNADTYKHVPMWEQVITMLRDEGNIGPVLQLRCPRHPEHPIEVSTPDHFLQFSPEGGCLRQCDRRLFCGHACVNRCHSQVLHQAVKCLEPCPRMKKGCSHPYAPVPVATPNPAATLVVASVTAAKIERMVSLVMAKRNALPALTPAKLAAATQSVASSATSLALLVLSSVAQACPDEKYCQACCSEDIKSTTVDWIMGMQYHEVDLDEDPCVFPDCGHFLTKSNMDGVMDLKAHYEMSAEDSPSPVALSSSSMPFSMDEVKKCPSCRGSLRNIARYGRIIRRATLDEATKKFMAWSHSEYLKLAGQLVNVQIGLEKARAPTAQLNTTRQSKLLLAKGRFQQLCFIRDWVGNSRYSDALRLWAQVSTFIGQVRKEEQPLQRVADFVRHASRQQQQQVTNDFVLDESVLQAKGLLQASALSLKCEIVIFTDFMTIRQPLITLRPEIKLDLIKQMKDCESLIEMAKSAHYPREQVEGHIYYAKFCSFARALTPEPSEDSKPDETTSQSLAKLKDQATAHVAAARELLTQYPSTRILEAEVDAAEKMLRDAIFYTKVSAAEMRAVYKAMAGEFLGTGHWYTCANGHPFTVGECGMPMEQARCPECGAPVGGAHHQAAEGVRHADEIEALARDVNRLGI